VGFLIVVNPGAGSANSGLVERARRTLPDVWVKVLEPSLDLGDLILPGALRVNGRTG